MGETTWTGNPRAILFQLPCNQCRKFRAVDHNHPFGMMLKPNHLCHYVCDDGLDLATYDSCVLAIRQHGNREPEEVLTELGKRIRREGCQKRELL